MVQSDAELRHHTVVVVDVLRATSTIIAALAAGAREVIPVDTVENAVKVAQRIGSDRALLCGERNSVRIEGFHLGNSPQEYTPEVVAGKTLILTTTNGTMALARTHAAGRVFCGSFLNAARLAEAIVGTSSETVTILCAGTHGRFSLDDVYAAGAIVSALLGKAGEATLLDGATAALHLFRTAADDMRGALAASAHGRTLIDLGFGSDLEYCARLDVEDAPVPVLDGSQIRPYIPGTDALLQR
jgi:2-phosphosulfolactate phosphatase